MKRIYILSICIWVGLSNFLDYSSNYLLQCKSIDPNLNFDQSVEYLWNIEILHIIDRMCFLIVCPILIIIEVIFILVFIKYKESLFKRQGTIFFAIIVIQTLKNLYVTLNPYGPSMPNAFPGFCMSFGVLNELCKTSLSLYLLYFIIYTLLNRKSSIKTDQIIKKRYIHSSVLFWSIGWCIFTYFEDRFGINEFGLCGQSSLRSNQVSWFYPIFDFLTTAAYILLSFYTYFYFKKHMPLSQGLVKKIYYENKIISVFVIIQSILIGIFETSITILYFNCFSSQPQPGLLIFATFMNISRLLQTIFIFYLIRMDPTIKKKLKKFLKSLFMLKNRSQQNLQSFATNHIKRTNIEDINEQELQDIAIRQRIFDLKQEEHQIDLFRVAQIMTIIAGINIAHREYFSKDTFYNHRINKLHFNEKITFHLEKNTLRAYNIDTYSLPQTVLRGTVTMVAPRIFNKLLRSDGLENVQQSFDLSKNYMKIYNIAEGNGGKSGQFFFFTYDYKYVLKTVTNEQYNFILENIELFFDYYEQNPNSLLAKIYGLYTIKGEDIGRQYKLILMKSMFCCKKKQVIRTYDLKGSKYHRQVIKNDQSIYNELEKLTLKDTDFINLQGKIHLHPQIVKDFRNIIRKDTIFLKNCNLIDYSLLIIRVRWQQKPQNERFWNQMQRIPSAQFENEYYHIGIIDYMQEWNISKKSENCFKSLMGKKQISAQQPNFYQKRFLEFIDSITHTQEYDIFSLVQENVNQKSMIQQFRTSIKRKSQKEVRTSKIMNFEMSRLKSIDCIVSSGSQSNSLNISSYKQYMDNQQNDSEMQVEDLDIQNSEDRNTEGSRSISEKISLTKMQNNEKQI